jgi:hypothetical protein
MPLQRPKTKWCPKFIRPYTPMIQCKNRPNYVTSAEDAYADANYVTRFCRGNFKDCHHYRDPPKIEERPKGPRVPVLANWLFRG